MGSKLWCNVQNPHYKSIETCKSTISDILFLSSDYFILEFALMTENR